MKIDNLCMSFGTQVIFDNASFQVNNNDKVGIIGVNGAGKSTLLNILLGNLTPDSGTIKLDTKIKIGYLPQVIMDDVEDKEETVFDYLLEGRPIKKLKKELEDLYQTIATIDNDYELKKYYKKIKGKKVIVLTKADIIPKNIKYNKLTHNIKNLYEIKEDIILTSSKKKLNISTITNLCLENKKENNPIHYNN